MEACSMGQGSVTLIVHGLSIGTEVCRASRLKLLCGGTQAGEFSQADANQIPDADQWMLQSMQMPESLAGIQTEPVRRRLQRCRLLLPSGWDAIEHAFLMAMGSV